MPEPDYYKEHKCSNKIIFEPHKNSMGPFFVKHTYVDNKALAFTTDEGH